MKICHACNKELELGRMTGRQDTCLFCRADLRCCLNCTFFEERAYNQCREPQAERVVEKSRGNFCDCFSFRDTEISEKRPQPPRDKLEILFRKE